MRSLPTAAALLPRSTSFRSPFRASREALSSTRPNLLRETVLLTSLFLVYRFGRAMIAGHVNAAMINAGDVWEVERLLRFPNELVFQQWALRWPDLVEAANWYYVGVHFPLTALFLVWGYVKRPPSDYRWARRLIITMTALALLIHTAMPLAPPRMMSRLGFVDTMATIGPSAYEGSAATVANQFAAMPSLHVGWALLLSVVVIRTTKRAMEVAHPRAPRDHHAGRGRDGEPLLAGRARRRRAARRHAGHQPAPEAARRAGHRRQGRSPAARGDRRDASVCLIRSPSDRVTA